MKALVFRVGQPPVLEEVAGFKGMQRLIGGYIERVVLAADGVTRFGYKGGIALWCDEDGIGKGLPPNVWAVGPTYAGAPIFGTAILTRFTRVHVGTENEDEVEVDLTEADIERWESLPRAVGS